MQRDRIDAESVCGHIGPRFLDRRHACVVHEVEGGASRRCDRSCDGGCHGRRRSCETPRLDSVDVSRRSDAIRFRSRHAEPPRQFFYQTVIELMYTSWPHPEAVCVRSDPVTSAATPPAIGCDSAHGACGCDRRSVSVRLSAFKRGAACCKSRDEAML